MKSQPGKTSWIAIGLFYLVMISVVSVLDAFNNVLSLPYWGMQLGLLTLGIGLFVAIGSYLSDLSASRGVLLAFTIGILTIIPAVLMGLGRIPNLWPQYFSIALGMAAGSFLTFIFLRLYKRVKPDEKSEPEINRFE